MVTARTYPRPSPKAPVGAHTWWWRYQLSWARRGREHPATHAAFGRYLASKGHVAQRMAESIAGDRANDPCWVAWKRASGSDPGYLNRRHRKALSEGKLSPT